MKLRVRVENFAAGCFFPWVTSTPYGLSLTLNISLQVLERKKYFP
jgi:hypothetical protein